MAINFSDGKWINRPSNFEISEDAIKITTDPQTDFWQRSYYGFRNDNAPALLFTSDENFTFTIKVSFNYRGKYDQCGLIIYINSENWFKASVEYESKEFSRLGSVVTNLGYSDWATTDISTPNEIWYRLNRRGPDFLIEASMDGEEFRQMRIFHLHKLGETTAEMGKANPPLPSKEAIDFGLYACSPLNSSFTTIFDNLKFEKSKWLAHG